MDHKFKDELSRQLAAIGWTKRDLSRAVARSDQWTFAVCRSKNPNPKTVYRIVEVINEERQLRGMNIIDAQVLFG